VTPDEVLAMPNAKQLLQVRGYRPGYADKLSYLDMPQMATEVGFGARYF
jgi:type IV secretory pathway TraG/TraD family ATPase VirD4